MTFATQVGEVRSKDTGSYNWFDHFFLCVYLALGISKWPSCMKLYRVCFIFLFTGGFFLFWLSYNRDHERGSSLRIKKVPIHIQKSDYFPSSTWIAVLVFSWRHIFCSWSHALLYKRTFKVAGLECNYRKKQPTGMVQHTIHIWLEKQRINRHDTSLFILCSVLLFIPRRHRSLAVVMSQISAFVMRKKKTLQRLCLYIESPRKKQWWLHAFQFHYWHE